MLLDPAGKKHMISCRLEFLCTNNTAEYEALIQGLKKVLDLNVKVLIAFGDSEIIVRQVRNSFIAYLIICKVIKKRYGF